MVQLYLPSSVGELAAQKSLPSASRQAMVEASVNPTLAALQLEKTQTNWVGKKGDLNVFITQKDLGDGRGKRPAMLIAARLSPKERHVFFPLEDLWLILEKDAEQIAMVMCERLYGGHTTRDDAFRVLDCLFEFGEDLKNAKPPAWISSREWLKALGEDGIIITQNGVALNG